MKELYLVLRIELGSFAICSNFCLFLFFFWPITPLCIELFTYKQLNNLNKPNKLSFLMWSIIRIVSSLSI